MTTKGQVQAALDKGWELYDEVKAAREKAGEARQAFNGLKGRQASEALKEEAAAAVALVAARNADVRDRAIAAAQVRLDHATEEYDKTAAAATNVRDESDAKTNDEWARKVADETQKLALLAATAQAEAHKLEQAAGALQAVLDSFTKATQAELGIDLKTFFGS